MMCGNIGNEHGGVNPLRGQNNVQGACDMGGLPNVYPGYQKVTDEKSCEKFSRQWGVPLSKNLGYTIPKMMAKAYDGSLKFMYVMGENPMISDPDLNHIEKALKNLEFLVVQDIFLTETAALADVVLPVTCFAEKNGTFTNTERRIQMVRKAVEGPGETRDDHMVFIELMRRLGYEQPYLTPEEIMVEISEVTPQYAGVRYNRLQDGLQWPCISLNHPGTKVLHQGTFAKGIGTFHETTYLEPDETCDAEYPFILTTGRILYQYHTRTMTGKTDAINSVAGEAYIEISKASAGELEVNEGEMVHVSSKRGTITVKVEITENVQENTVFIPFHFAEGAANKLTNAALDPITDIPEYKVCAVRIEKVMK
jgi:formate dehydrogenase major subunit